MISQASGHRWRAGPPRLCRKFSLRYARPLGATGQHAGGDEGRPCHRGPVPPSGHAHGRARVGGVAAEHAPGRSTHGGTGRGGSSRPHEPGGHHLSPPTRGSRAPAPAVRLAPWAHGGDGEARDGGGAVARARGRPIRRAPGLVAPRTARPRGRLTGAPAGAPLAGGPRDAPAGRQGRPGSGPQPRPPGARPRAGAPPGPRPPPPRGPRPESRHTAPASPARGPGVCGRPRHAGRAGAEAQAHATTGGGEEGAKGRTAPARCYARAAASPPPTGTTASARPPEHNWRHNPPAGLVVSRVTMPPALSASGQ